MSYLTQKRLFHTGLFLVVAGLALMVKGTWGKVLPWKDWPVRGAFYYNNFYQDSGLSFEGAYMARKAMNLENDQDSVLHFLPPDPNQPGERKFVLVSNLTNGLSKEEFFVFRRQQEAIRWSHYRVRLFDSAGAVIREGDFNIDDPSFASPPDLYQSSSFQFALMTLPFQEGFQQNLLGWTNPQIAFEISLEVLKDEPVKTPAGTFACHHVRMGPVISDYFGTVVGKLVRPFAPAYDIWYQAQEPRVLARFEGGVAVSPSLDIPVVIRELVKMDHSAPPYSPSPALAPALPAPSAEGLLEEMTYQVSYEDPTLDMSKRPFAQRILDLDQPLVSHVLIETGGADPSARKIYFNEQLRNGTTRVTALELQKQPSFRWKAIWIEQKNQEGEVIRREYNQVSHPAFAYPPEVITPQGMWLTLRDLRYEVGAKSTGFIYMNPTLMANVTIQMSDRETIHVPAGTFECWKVEVTPHASEYLGSAVGRLVQRFVPNYTIWIETATSHRLIKYHGVLGQMPSTLFIYFNFELTSYSQTGRRPAEKSR